MNRFVLFDLDNTLVDSLHLKPLRDARRWPSVYAQIKTVTLFHGIVEMWTKLRALNLCMANR
jgi:FMN phosphatase YigB (HAD superfamily)